MHGKCMGNERLNHIQLYMLGENNNLSSIFVNKHTVADTEIPSVNPCFESLPILCRVERNGTRDVAP